MVQKGFRLVARVGVGSPSSPRLCTPYQSDEELCPRHLPQHARVFSSALTTQQMTMMDFNKVAHLNHSSHSAFSVKTCTNPSANISQHSLIWAALKNFLEAVVPEDLSIKEGQKLKVKMAPPR